MPRKQFEPIQLEDVVTPVTDHVSKFVPEMSLPIKDILSQFAYIDQVRLGDLARQGYNIGNDDDSDFDLPEFDQMDIAEKEEVYHNARKLCEHYEKQLKESKDPTTKVDEAAPISDDQPASE